MGNSYSYTVKVTASYPDISMFLFGCNPRNPQYKIKKTRKTANGEFEITVNCTEELISNMFCLSGLPEQNGILELEQLKPTFMRESTPAEMRQVGYYHPVKDIRKKSFRK